MKRQIALLLCLLITVTAASCGYSDKTARIPDTWPRYTIGGMSFPCEAGWLQGDIESFDASSELAYSLLDTSNQMNWVAFMQNDEKMSGAKRFLSISYLKMNEKVSDSLLEGYLEKLGDLKSAFTRTGTITFMLTYPEIGQYGSQTALYFSARFTLNDAAQTQVVAQTGLVGCGDRLYQFTFMDFGSDEDERQLAAILSGLEWVTD